MNLAFALVMTPSPPAPLPNTSPDAMPVWMIVAFVVLLPLWFAFMTSLISFVLAHIGGWAALARDFRTCRPAPARNRFGSGAVWFGLARYRGGVTVVPQPDGLDLRMAWLFSLGHPSLLVPYAALSPLQEKRGLFNSRVYELRITSPRVLVNVTLFDDALAQAVEQARLHAPQPQAPSGEAA